MKVLNQEKSQHRVLTIRLSTDSNDRFDQDLAPSE